MMTKDPDCDMKYTMVPKTGLLLLFLLLSFSCRKTIYTGVYAPNPVSRPVGREITENIRPPYLSAGDSVALIATSNYVDPKKIAESKQLLESWGLKVREARNLYYQNGRYAGTAAQRAEGLQELIDNPNIKALIATRGGYGCAQIIDRIDFTPLETAPKWFVGYSDLTVIHTALNNRGIETIHGPMAGNFSEKMEPEQLRKALFGEFPAISIETNAACVEGVAEGRLVGGNLSILYSLQGTGFESNMTGAILFIEDIGEANYAVDRMLMNLRLSGKLNGVKGVVVGQFTGLKTGVDKNIEEMISDAVAGLGIPVLYGIESGHGQPNLPLYLGRPVKLEVTPTTGTLIFKE